MKLIILRIGLTGLNPLIERAVIFLCRGGARGPAHRRRKGDWLIYGAGGSAQRKGDWAQRKGDWLIYGAKLVECACPRGGRGRGRGTVTFYLLAPLQR